MPPRSYLDKHVMPTLLNGLQQLVRERPSDPVEFLAGYLLKNNPSRGMGGSRK